MTLPPRDGAQAGSDASGSVGGRADEPERSNARVGQSRRSRSKETSDSPAEGALNEAGEHLLTPQQVAEMLAVTSRKVRDLVENKEIRHVKVGRSVRFDRLDVREYVESRKVQPRAGVQDSRRPRARRRTRKIRFGDEP